jgi:hypothetical protein
MKLTNQHNLPLPIVRAMESMEAAYDAGRGGSDYSTTGLLLPPRIAQLRRQHGAELVEDAADRLWSLYGQIAHRILYESAEGHVAELRLNCDFNGITVSGQVDLVEGDTLTDYKFVTRYATKDGVKDEWVQQGQINRLLCERSGIPIKKIQYVAMYRDWSKLAAEREQEYPPEIEQFDIPMWDMDKTRAFIEERIRLHEAAKVELPLCSAEERWAKPEKWALMKKGGKRAVKLYDLETEAAEAAANAESIPGVSKNYSVEHRPGENTRCLHYCSVSAYCAFFRELMQEAQP